MNTTRDLVKVVLEKYEALIGRAKQKTHEGRTFKTIQLRPSCCAVTVFVLYRVLAAATLAQKNSEATRALAMQEDILEKELGEIQKVLLAMQEQQQKQLELILAIGKTGKLFESRRESNQELDTLKTSNMVDVAEQMETHKTQATGSGRGSNNDRS
ncbi:hypothetical protein Patl1_28222 [Pistacia atlantica]|uniref:Uncharacterized protein n=1 Tax=Pistacia atlantica TaxID=434234 RepID=A0ACC1BG25_9ROSI|nr:hypothetical protein Patl1_28222 [Pistacia atlantica]